MNLIGLLPGVLLTVGKVLGIGGLDSAADAITSATMSPDLKVKLELALQEHEAEMKRLGIEELKTVLSETNAMIASPDKFVARARPTGLYVAYAISVALTVSLVAGLNIDPTAVLTICGPLYGAQSLYIHSRTKEKLNGGGHS
jgi:hypothetical protein